MSLKWEDVLQGDPFDPKGTEFAARGVISQIFSDGTVDLIYKGGVARRVRMLATDYAPRTGDLVEVVRRNSASLLVLGPLRVINDTAIEVNASIGILFNINPKPAPTSSFGGANPVTFPVISTASNRGKGWERDQVFQGAYSPQYGYWKGLYFYGDAPQILNGRRVTFINLRISRAGEGGGINNVPQHIACHVHASQPAGSPLFSTGAINVGSANRSQPQDVALPVDWGQALVEGRTRGFGHWHDSTSNYSINNSKAADANTGLLTVGWA